MRNRYNIIFLGKEGCAKSDVIFQLLKKTNNSILYYKINENNLNKIKIKLKNLKNNYIDYLFSYRSHLILSKKIISKIKIAAINFHPGTPKYRGIGCTNFALYNQEKIYGSTCHIIDENIDSGKILNVKLFKIRKNENLESLLEKTHKIMLSQSKFIIKKIFENKDNFKKLIKNGKQFKWSKKLYLRKDLNNLYKIDRYVSKKKLDLIINSCNSKNFKPYVFLHGKKFFYLD